jgi:hypothetical protein
VVAGHGLDLRRVRGGATVEDRSGSDIIKDWPEESREAAQLVIDT